jgi:hypothetical protein
MLASGTRTRSLLDAQFHLKTAFADHQRAVFGHALPERIEDHRGNHVVVPR